MGPRASKFFLSQRTARWRWVWLLLSIPAGVAAAIATLEVGRVLGSSRLGALSDELFGEELLVATAPA